MEIDQWDRGGGGVINNYFLVLIWKTSKEISCLTALKKHFQFYSFWLAELRHSFRSFGKVWKTLTTWLKHFFPGLVPMATQAVAANQRKRRVIAADAEEEQRSGNNICLFSVFQSPLSAVISIVFLSVCGHRSDSTCRCRARSYVNNKSATLCQKQSILKLLVIRVSNI